MSGRTTYVVIAGINWEGQREPVVEIPRQTLLAARDTMRELVGKTMRDALATEGAEPDGIGWVGENTSAAELDEVLAGFTIATYDEDQGTTDEMDFNAEGKAS